MSDLGNLGRTLTLCHTSLALATKESKGLPPPTGLAFDDQAASRLTNIARHHHGLYADRARAEYAKARLIYENLGIEELTAATYYRAYRSGTRYEDRETFEFLAQHLDWPPRSAPDRNARPVE